VAASSVSTGIPPQTVGSSELPRIGYNSGDNRHAGRAGFLSYKMRSPFAEHQRNAATVCAGCFRMSIFIGFNESMPDYVTETIGTFAATQKTRAVMPVLHSCP
jgi:hypothetical protein